MKNCLIFVLLISWAFANNISEYKILKEEYTLNNKTYTIIRSFSLNDEKKYLVVDNNTLNTKIINISEIENKKEAKNKDNRYKSLLENNFEEPFLLQNYGVRNLNSDKVYLTVDMCPSQKESYEKEFYHSLAIQNKNIPLVIFITGKWIENHQNDLNELINYSKEKKLNIIWGNHSLTHFYNKELPFENNFLLKENTDVISEVLELEKILISKGITPSILFRFPGLVSDKNAVEKINSLGLVVIGANAWLAKGEEIKDGSIILVHGNKNEHKGIEIFNKITISKNLNYGNILKDF